MLPFMTDCLSWKKVSAATIKQISQSKVKQKSAIIINMVFDYFSFSNVTILMIFLVLHYN